MRSIFDKHIKTMFFFSRLRNLDIDVRRFFFELFEMIFFLWKIRTENDLIYKISQVYSDSCN